MTRSHPSRTTRRGALAALGAAAVGSLAGCSGGTSSGGGSFSAPKTTPGGPASDPTLPADPSTHAYATMGADDAPVSVTYVGNWKCPVCDRFEENGPFDSLVTDYVNAGTVQLTFRALAYGPKGKRPFLGSDAPRASRAGLSVWNSEPETYWAYHAYVFANQPSEKRTWATTDHLVTMARRAGCSEATVSTLKNDLSGSTYASALQDTVTYADDNGITSTPTVVIDGSTTLNPLQSKQLKSHLDAAANGSAN